MNDFETDVYTVLESRGLKLVPHVAQTRSSAAPKQSGYRLVWGTPLRSSVSPEYPMRVPDAEIKTDVRCEGMHFLRHR
jgi:hypothetical protein